MFAGKGSEAESMIGLHKTRLYIATSVSDAVLALADRGESGEFLAGATWIMRAPLRQERQVRSYVAIAKLEELRRIEIFDQEVIVGSCVTHAELADGLRLLPELKVLATAAGSSANPAVRQMATIGGNLSTTAFAAADLVPALLCLEAEIDIETPEGSQRLTIEEFLRLRSSGRPVGLVRQILVPRRSRATAHARLPLRKAGDYPVAIVSVQLS
jgi:carbon-monoxide dehydrogenase medium subunit